MQGILSIQECVVALMAETLRGLGCVLCWLALDHVSRQFWGIHVGIPDPAAAFVPVKGSARPQGASYTNI